MYPLFQYSEAHASLHLVSKCQVRKRYQHVHFFWFHHGQFFVVHGNSYSFFFIICQTELVAPIRDCRIDTYLNHGMNCLKQELRIHSISIEVNGTSTSSLLQDPTTQSSGTCEDGMTSFFELLYHFVGCAIPLSLLIVRFATPSLFRPWTRQSPMSW